MKITIDIFPWPSRESEDSEDLQGDAYVDGEWLCGWTGPGDEQDLFCQGADLVSQVMKERGEW